MDTKQLDRTLGDLASSLGDSTRRGIYLAVRQAPNPVTVADIAEEFSIHPNVARHHLDRLESDGYVKVSHDRPKGRDTAAGRPAKCYEATSKEIDLHFPARRYDLLSELLLRVVEKMDSDDVSEVADAVGRDYGRELAGRIDTQGDSGFEAAIKAVAKTMTRVGFEMAPDPENQRLLTNHCPFGATATDHPDLICVLDRGIVSGMFEILGQNVTTDIHPHTRLDEACVTNVPVKIAAR